MNYGWKNKSRGKYKEEEIINNALKSTLRFSSFAGTQLIDQSGQSGFGAAGLIEVHDVSFNRFIQQWESLLQQLFGLGFIPGSFDFLNNGPDFGFDRFVAQIPADTLS